MPSPSEKPQSHGRIESIELQQGIRNSSPRRHGGKQYVLKRAIPAILMLLALFSLFRKTFVRNHHYDPAISLRPMNAVDEEGAKDKVPLEVHVMSKCPDARDCLRELIVPTMVNVSEKVNFTMSFIGRYYAPVF